MEKTSGLTVRDKKVIYLNDKPLLEDTFDMVLEFKGYLIAYNQSGWIVFINPDGYIVSSLKGNIHIVQIINNGEYISLKSYCPLCTVMGVFSYCGDIIVPFQYDSVFISDNGINQLLIDFLRIAVHNSNPEEPIYLV